VPQQYSHKTQAFAINVQEASPNIMFSLDFILPEVVREGL